MNVLSSRLDLAEERISEMEEISEEVIQNTAHREKKDGKTKREVKILAYI